MGENPSFGVSSSGRTSGRNRGANSALARFYRTSLKRTGAPVALGRNWGARAPKHSSD